MDDAELEEVARLLEEQPKEPVPEERQEVEYPEDHRGSVSDEVIDTPFNAQFYTATEKAKKFHSECEQNAASLVDGAGGSGKSVITIAQALKWAIQRAPGSIGVIGAATLPSLFKTAWQTFKEIVNPFLVDGYPDWDFMSLRKVPEYTDIHNLRGGLSRIYWVPYDKEGKIRGINARWAVLEEASEIKKSIFDQLMFRMRKYDPGESWVVLNTNPDSPTHWIYRYFYEERTKMPGTKVYTFLPTDNPHISAKKIQEYMMQYPPGTMWHERMLLGRWVAPEGAVWPEFRRAGPWVMPGPFLNYLPTHYVGIDYGWKDPTAVVLASITTDGRVIVRDEWVSSGKVDVEVVQAINEMLTRNRVSYAQCRFILDKSAAGFGAQLYMSSDKKISTIKSQSQNKNERMRRAYGLGKSGRLTIMPKCEKLIAELFGLRWKEHSGKEVIIGSDHAVDALLYLLEQMEAEQGIYRNMIALVNNPVSDDLVRDTMKERMFRYAERMSA